MSKNYRLGLIGCGLRGVWYLHNMKEAGLPISIVALADTDKKFCKIANKLFSGNNATLFDNGEDLIRESDLDGVIIASPNDAHCGSMVLAAKKGLKILLEKPVATTIDQFQQMWHAHQKYDANIIVGFCLRYTPFYSKINEILESGEIGQILVINAEELMSDDLSMVFNRGDWRSVAERSGGLILEKCSHDLDIVNWFANSKVEQVFSNSRRTFLKPKKDLGPVCSQCKDKDSCRFRNSLVIEPFEAEWPEELHEMFSKFDNDTCAYRNHHHPDHQTATVSYENGVLCNFTVAQAQSSTQRTIHILGSKGRIYGAFNDNCLTVYKHDANGKETSRVIQVYPDASGHGGGDSVLTNDFFELLKGNVNIDRPGLQEGIEAGIICLAADQSAELQKPVELADMRTQIFMGNSETIVNTTAAVPVK